MDRFPTSRQSCTQSRYKALSERILRLRVVTPIGGIKAVFSKGGFFQQDSGASALLRQIRAFGLVVPAVHGLLLTPLCRDGAKGMDRLPTCAGDALARRVVWLV